jgi:hypothetical protein
MAVLAVGHRWLPKYVKSWGSESPKRQPLNLALAVDFVRLDFPEVEAWEAGWGDILAKVWAEVWVEVEAWVWVVDVEWEGVLGEVDVGGE